MTSLAEAAGKSGSRARLIWAALVLSLVLNVCFVGGLVWSRVQAERPTTPAERFQQVARDMNLAGSERENFQQFFQTVRRETQQMRENNRPVMQHIWSELDKEHPDLAAIGQLIDQATENRRAYQKDMAAALAGFLATLTPAQRSRFVELLAKHQQDQNAAHIRRLITP
jgi:uncharacterized membrane protein